MYCQVGMNWGDCANRVKAAITATNDPKVAFEAASEWAGVYRKLYLAAPQVHWQNSDQDRFEAALSDLWSELVGPYVDLAGILEDLILKRYAVTLSAVLAWLGNPWLQGLYHVFAPSPIANDFTAAFDVNRDIATLTLSKLPPAARISIQQHFPNCVSEAYKKCTGSGLN